MTVPRFTLNDGYALPAIGLGTWAMSDDEAATAVAEGIRTGYRLIDTAASYGNEAGVGRGIAESGVLREELIVTSKLRGRDQGYEETLRAFETTRRDLGVEYVNLYLIHWPLPRQDKYVETWKAMIKLREDGLVRSIGVSNFTAEHLDRIIGETGVAPSVNQIELHPGFPQDEMRRVDAERGIVTQSWRPLGKGRLLDAPAVVEAAGFHGVSPAQVILRWLHQLGTVPIPKSADPQRQKENFDIFRFNLRQPEMERISAMAGGRLGGDPDTHEEF
ncbi:aldo/keto reductase [Georgenia thermotolerans]|uniref:Aldo/keto reductase n=1 Tax=Georgenia thermotolerans TaxID=527326 RepID=A0A7J5UQ44_9MICO|nr:aldo/keto reductase [Georgenia thermotolerans]KAE8764234.1 aldo/keto reductase [Georgenia thermotolerans]